MIRYKPLSIIKNISKTEENIEYSKSLLRNNKKYFSFEFLSEKVIDVNLYVSLVLKILDNFYKKYKNNIFKSSKMTKALNEIFKSYKFIFEYIGSIEKDEEKTGINIMGTKVDKKDKFPYIHILCNLYIGKCLENRENYENFRKKFQLLIEHEFIHRTQFLLMADKKLRYKVNSSSFDRDEEYFGDYREIMTYAKQMIEELRFNGKTDNEILNIVNNRIRNESSILDLYLKLFKNKNDKVLKKLYKYIYEYLKG